MSNTIFFLLKAQERNSSNTWRIFLILFYQAPAGYNLYFQKNARWVNPNTLAPKCQVP